jgi:membrane fusion protein (multidrug efflux system)
MILSSLLFPVYNTRSIPLRPAADPCSTPSVSVGPLLSSTPTTFMATPTTSPPASDQPSKTDATATQPSSPAVTPAPTAAPAPGPVEPRKFLRHGLAVFFVLLAAVAGGLYYYFFMAPYESTDDAFIEGHVTAIAPQVAGRVARVLVQDNQLVQPGDLLLEIDSRDYDVKVAQVLAGVAAAQSHVDQTKAQLSVDQAKADQEQANVTAVLADASRAQADLQRYQSVDSRAVARSQVDLANDQAQATAAQVDVARARARAAQAQVGLSQANVVMTGAELQLAEGYAKQAELDLSYTKVTAPVAGRVTRRAVESGNYVQTGQTLMAIVPSDAWVVANFKETQLAHMRPGQPVAIYVDAYPQYSFKGHVDSIQAGSGGRFSLLPPENATGNYVKIVQRVPVKIVFDGPPPADCFLSPGLSVVPVVTVK